MTSDALKTSKEQLIYLILPRLKHDEWCKDWHTCCTAMENANVMVDLFTQLPGEGDDVVDAINQYEVDATLADVFGDLDKDTP